MTRNQNDGAAQRPKPPNVGRSFEEERRIAEHLVQAFREAGYSCVLSDDGHTQALKREN